MERKKIGGRASLAIVKKRNPDNPKATKVSTDTTTAIMPLMKHKSVSETNDDAVNKSSEKNNDAAKKSRKGAFSIDTDTASESASESVSSADKRLRSSVITPSEVSDKPQRLHKLEGKQFKMSLEVKGDIVSTPSLKSPTGQRKSMSGTDITFDCSSAEEKEGPLLSDDESLTKSEDGNQKRKSISRRSSARSKSSDSVDNASSSKIKPLKSVIEMQGVSRISDKVVSTKGKSQHVQNLSDKSTISTTRKLVESSKSVPLITETSKINRKSAGAQNLDKPVKRGNRKSDFDSTDKSSKQDNRRSLEVKGSSPLSSAKKPVGRPARRSLEIKKPSTEVQNKHALRPRAVQKNETPENKPSDLNEKLAGPDKLSGSDKKPTGSDKKQSGTDKKPSEPDILSSGSQKRPSGSGKRPSGSDKLSSGSDKKPTGLDKKQSDSDEPPSGSDRKQPSIDKRQTVLDKKPSGSEKSTVFRRSRLTADIVIAQKGLNETEKSASTRSKSVDGSHLKLKRRSNNVEKPSKNDNRRSSIVEKPSKNDEGRSSTVEKSLKNDERRSSTVEKSLKNDDKRSSNVEKPSKNDDEQGKKETQTMSEQRNKKKLQPKRRARHIVSSSKSLILRTKTRGGSRFRAANMVSKKVGREKKRKFTSLKPAKGPAHVRLNRQKYKDNVLSTQDSKVKSEDKAKSSVSTPDDQSIVKRKRGRPKKMQVVETGNMSDKEQCETVKKKEWRRGRRPGSKNKRKCLTTKKHRSKSDGHVPAAIKKPKTSFTQTVNVKSNSDHGNLSQTRVKWTESEVHSDVTLKVSQAEVQIAASDNQALPSTKHSLVARILEVDNSNKSDASTSQDRLEIFTGVYDFFFF